MSSQRSLRARARHLSRAPITEAIIDIRVQARKDLSVTELKSLATELKHEYPNLEEQRVVETTIQVVPVAAAPQTIARGVHGYLLRSEDKASIIQLRVDGFTFNRLKPYTSWDEVFPQMLAGWERYADVARPEGVTRIGARFINHIPLPAQLDDLGEFLLALPPYPEGVEATVSGFFTQVVIHHPELPIAATVRQAVEADLASSGPTLLLDIDVFSNRELGSTTEELTRRFSMLHDYKNDIFFGSLTEDAVKGFE